MIKMEASENVECGKQFLMAGTRQCDILCQPCQDEDENVQAESYCETCTVFICSSCLRVHRKLPTTKNYVTKSTDGMQRTRVQTDPCLEPCAIHKTEIVKFYCQSHDEVGCGDCMVEHNIACKVVLVSDVPGKYCISEELNRVKHHIEKLVKEIAARKHEVTCNLKASAEMNLKVVEDIKRFRKDMNIYLDNAEADLLNEVEKLRNTDVSLQNKLQDECDYIQKEMEEMKSRLDVSTKQIDKLFVSVKLANKKLKLYQGSVSHITSQCRMNIYKFEPTKELMTLKANKPTLGTLSIKSRKTSGSRHSRSMVDMKADFVKMLPVKATNETPYSISGLAMISCDEIVLADNENYVLKILNVRENKIKSSYKLSHYPWDITMINPGSVAVTVPDERRILFMNTKNGLSESHSLNVRGKCHGIDHNNRVLAVSFCRPPAVQILDIKGDILHEVSDTSMLRYTYYIAFSHDNESVYVSDYGKHTVYELTIDGQIKAAIKCGDKSYPFGLVVTGDGSVIVCCEGISDRVSIIEPTTRKALSIPVKHVQKPFSILVCEEINKIYISEFYGSKDSNTIKIFDMKYGHV